MLEFFFTQLSVLALIALVGLVVFVFVLSFILGGVLGGWDWQEGLDSALRASIVVAAAVAALWLAGLVVCALVDLFGGVVHA